jgi:hypothetical protein
MRRAEAASMFLDTFEKGGLAREETNRDPATVRCKIALGLRQCIIIHNDIGGAFQDAARL